MKLEDELIETPDGAFLSAIVPNQLPEDELKLEPYSLMRQSVAISFGVRHTAENGFFDSVVIVWLMTLGEDEVLDAQLDRKKSLKAAFHWAEARGYSLTNFAALLKTYKKVMREIERSTNAVVAGDGTPEKNSGGQPQF